MSTVTIPYTLANGAPADATQLMANYTAVANVINGQLDDTNIVSSAGINPTKISGTAITQSTLATLGTHNSVWNPFLTGTVGSPPTLPSWTVGAHSVLTLADSTVVTGANSLADASASDLFVCWQVIGTSLNAANSGVDIDLVPGKQYVVSADVKTAAGASSVFLAVQNASSYSSGNTNIQSVTVYHTGGGTYEKIYSVFTVPTSCSNIAIALIKPATTTSVTVCSFATQQGASPTPAYNNDHTIPSLGRPAQTYRTIINYNNGTTTITTLSTSFVEVDTNYRATVTTHGGFVVCQISLGAFYNNNNAGGNVTMFVDGANVFGSSGHTQIPQGNVSLGSSVVANMLYASASLAAGSHTFSPYWNTSDGTKAASLQQSFAGQILVMEYMT